MLTEIRDITALNILEIFIVNRQQDIIERTVPCKNAQRFKQHIAVGCAMHPMFPHKNLLQQSIKQYDHPRIHFSVYALQLHEACGFVFNDAREEKAGQGGMRP